ncbi:hypothetical protein ACIOMM_29495 [Streptomyces sp. NPDC087908]|uniref:hypothetical protein n=1 Tax=unclassified Streptomyces TaxID=2593676 RepID=UPI0016506C85|nr:hypothetical protein [Streptomyces sp. adm13(2018)]
MWESFRVGSLGGPLLVCDLEAFSDWGGAAYDSDLELDPACDHARAWSAVHPDNDDLEAAFVRFGEDEAHGGLVWDTDGDGAAEIAHARSRRSPADSDDHFLVMRSWIPAGRTDAPRRHAARAVNEEQKVGQLAVRSGRVVVVATGVDADETGSYATPREREASLRALGRLNPPVQLHLEDQRGLGTVLWVRPGTYRVTCGWHEGARGRYMPEEEMNGPLRSYADDDWSCRWVRFTWCGEPLDSVAGPAEPVCPAAP